MRWAGGKQRMIHQLREYLPRHDSYSRYFEPFLGGGSMFFSQPWENAVLSDLNYHLINTYRQVKERPVDLHKLAEAHTTLLNEKGEHHYYGVREAYNNHLQMSELPEYETPAFREQHLEQAARFLFLIYANYNGIFRVNSDGKYNVPMGKGTVYLPPMSHLKQASERLQTADLRSGTYLDLKDEIEDRAFVYLNPPFPNIQPLDHAKKGEETSFSQDKAHPLSEAHHDELAGFARAIKEKGAQVMVSVAELAVVPLDEAPRTKLRKMYPEEEGWYYNPSGFSRTVSNSKPQHKVRELIVTSYKPETKQVGLF